MPLLPKLRNFLSFAKSVPRRQSAACEDARNHSYQLELDPALGVAKEREGARSSVVSAPVASGDDGRVGLALACGESLSTPQVPIVAESCLSVGFHVDGGTAGKVEILFEPAGEPGTWRELATLSLDAFHGDCAFDIPLAGLSCDTLRLKVRRAPGSPGDAWLQLLRIAPRHLAGRANALASYDYRMRNEVAHFSGAAYTHRMYGEESTTATAGPGIVRAATVEAGPDIALFEATMRDRIATTLGGLRPNPDEVAFNFALRALGALLPMQPPNFFARAAKMRERGPLRLLSILSGAARIEEQLLAHCGEGAELTLVDASRDLVERAAARLEASHPGVKVDCLVGDINRGLPGSGRHHVILCVSALHHVANLEQVLSEVNARLEDDGEFWSIGEQIGRNGNRLWPEALAAANAAFAPLPERLRRNAHTGAVDAVVSDRDFSTGCFEGIRSEELETMLEAHFIPDHVYKRNAFLWRLVDATYSDNFTLGDEEDLGRLKELVAAEAMHWASGGRSTELHGVYRKKRIVAPG